MRITTQSILNLTYIFQDNNVCKNIQFSPNLRPNVYPKEESEDLRVVEQYVRLKSKRFNL